MLVVAEQRQRMNRDRVGDDEFDPRQAHAVVGQHREAECLVGLGDVEHDLRFGPVDVAERHFLDRVIEFSLVDVALVAFGTRNRDLAGRPCSTCVPCCVPTMAGNPSSRLTIAAWQVRPPRLVTMAAAFFITGSQSGSVLSVTSTSPGLKLADLVDVGDHAARAPGRSVAHALAGGQHFAPVLQVIRFQDVAILECLHRLGACLHDVDFAGLAVLGPFDVHRAKPVVLAAVVFLDLAAPAGELQHVVVAHREPRAVALGHRNRLGHLGAARCRGRA